MTSTTAAKHFHSHCAIVEAQVLPTHTFFPTKCPNEMSPERSTTERSTTLTQKTNKFMRSPRIIILCAFPLLVATACDNGTAQDTTTKTNSAQLQLEQEKLHQANVEKCAEQMNKSILYLDTRSNHYNDRLKKCFVLTTGTTFGTTRTKTTYIFDPYENVQYLVCLEMTVYTSQSDPVLSDFYHDQGEKFPAIELPGRIWNYMDE